METLLDQYQKERLEVATFSPKTVETYVSSIQSFCSFVSKQFQLQAKDARGKHLQAWLKDLRPSISRSRLRQHQYAIKSFFAFLFKSKVISKNPAAALPNIQRKSCKKIEPISSEEAFRLLAAVDRSDWLGRRNHLIIVLLWCLGLRISELTRLQVQDFEPEHEPNNRIGLLRVHGKNKKQRALFVVDFLYDELCSYLKDPLSPKHMESPLFPTNKGETLSHSRIQKMMKGYVAKAGIHSTVTPHILRHTFATEMYRQGVPLYAIQAMMGHEKKEETSLYIHVPLQMQQEALGKITLSGGTPCQ